MDPGGGGGLAARSGTEFNERFFCWLQRGRKGNWANFVPRNSPTVQFDSKSTQCQGKATNNQNLRTLVNNIFTINEKPLSIKKKKKKNG